MICGIVKQLGQIINNYLKQEHCAWHCHVILLYEKFKFSILKAVEINFEKYQQESLIENGSTAKQTNTMPHVQHYTS